MNNNRRRRIEIAIDTVITLITITVIITAVCCAGYIIDALV